MPQHRVPHPSPSLSPQGERGRARGVCLLLTAYCLLLTHVLVGGPAWAEDRPTERARPATAEERFFRDCPSRRAWSWHDDTNSWDLHALLFTTLGVMELEVLRVADWVMDLPLPGEPVRPFHRLRTAVRSGYHRLPPWKVTQRLGEFVDAWQLPEISLGDVSATYSVATGGVSGPGSGMVVRAHKLVDWTQHVIGDVNRLGGRLIPFQRSPLGASQTLEEGRGGFDHPDGAARQVGTGLAGRTQKLVTWSLPERMADGAQRLVVTTFTHVSVLVGRVLEGSLTALEMAGEGVINLGRRRRHEEQTVFLRVTEPLYRAHEVWFLEHQGALWMGSPEALAAASHAELLHARGAAKKRWPLIEWPKDAEVMVVVTTTALMAVAPDGLRAAVVPATWALQEVSDTF